MEVNMTTLLVGIAAFVAGWLMRGGKKYEH